MKEKIVTTNKMKSFYDVIIRLNTSHLTSGNINYELVNCDKLVKSQSKEPRWLDKKADIQGAVFLAGA